MPREHGEGGEFVETVTLDDVLGVFDVVRGPVVFSADVADELGCSRETARRKLEALHDRGDLERRKAARRVVYWRTGDDHDTESGRERDETPTHRNDSVNHGTHAEPEQAGAAGRDAATTREDATDDSIADAVDAIAEDVLPGSGAKLEARGEAFRAAVEYLREHGTATPSDFQTDVYPTHSGRYTEGKDPAYSWWTNCIYKGLRELAERTDAVEKADTTGEWSWRGESA